MTNKKNKKAWAWLIFGALFLGYFFIESLFIGVNFHSLLWCWAVGGAICIILSLVTFKHGKLPLPKWLFFAIVIVLVIILTFFCFIEGLIISEMPSSGEDGLDYIIVLGAKVNRNEVPSKPLYWRIDAAEEYLNNNPQTIAILSGGKGADEPISEAQCMFNELTKRGIAPERLILEDKSRDTNQNIRNSLSIMPSDASFGVVTNNFHVYRAVRISEKLSGKKVSGIASQYKDALLIHYMAREAVGIFTDVIDGNMNFFE
ncbi:MAG: YdcF family protein [Ruminococcaceae bacterium]|nr:YdcF family protein [Oscillospiraceae bacterium]